ncbi:MAG: hypothetical protein ACXWQA_03500 [Pseudobdellovibrionaceae bacterium]
MSTYENVAMVTITTPDEYRIELPGDQVGKIIQQLRALGDLNYV